MSKRFADTKLSSEAWYRKLTPVFKAAWRFLTDECDQAGSWSIDAESLDFHVGAPVDLPSFISAVNSDKENRVIIFDEGRKLLIVGFVKFQYGALSADCKAHTPIIKRCEELKHLKGYPKGIHTLKEKEEDKETEKEKEKEILKRGPADKMPLPPLALAWNEHCGELPKVLATNTARSRRVAERMREEPDINAWIAIIQRMAASEFCNGRLPGKGVWRADFDWLLQPEVRLKVLEGKYDNRGQAHVDPYSLIPGGAS